MQISVLDSNFKLDENQRKVATVFILIALKIKDATMLQTIFKKKAKFSTLMLEIHE